MEDDEKVLNAVMAKAHDCTTSRDMELLGNAPLRVYDGLISIMSMGLVTTILHIFERIKTLRKESHELERRLLLCAKERDEAVVKTMVAEELARKNHKMLLRF